jgi:hypothetical protein
MAEDNIGFTKMGRSLALYEFFMKSYFIFVAGLIGA